MPRPRPIVEAEPEEAFVPPFTSPASSIPLDHVPAQPGRTPERQRLAEAIERVRATEAEIAEAGAAVDEARQAMYAASRAQDAAEEQLRRARPREAGGHDPALGPRSFWGSEAEVADAARRAREDAQGPPVSIAEAKAALADATDAYDSARRLLQHHEGRLRQANDRVGMYRSNVRDAVRHVLRADPALLALARASRRASTHAEALRRAFGEATGGEVIQTGSPFYGAGSPAWESDDPEGFAPLYAWRAALAQIVTDPDAPLPAV